MDSAPISFRENIYWLELQIGLTRGVKKMTDSGIEIVYLDMDGVLVDFVSGLHRALGLDYSYLDYPYKPNKWDIFGDIIKRANLEPSYFYEINNLCTTDFWKNLGWMHDGLEVFELVLKKFDLDQIYLLTDPMPNVESATGKWMWVKENIPELYKKTIITQAPKSLFAKSNVLLIDDKNESVEGFKKAGGKACLLPRYWNRLHALGDISCVFLDRWLMNNL